MNSNDPNFDWHKAGVWMVHDPKGEPQLASIADNPYGARAQFLRIINQRWSALAAEGYVVQEYEPVIPVLLDVIQVSDQVAVAAEARWRYPANSEPAPPGVTVQLLTRGGVSVRGVWNDLGDYIAWAPMIKRDKELEERLGL